MKHAPHLALGIVAFLLALVPALLCPSQNAAMSDTPTSSQAASREQLKQWIAQLGDDDFDNREAATRALKDRDDAAPLLRKALKSPDVEVCHRAAEILTPIDRKRAPRELGKALALAKDGRIDEVVERLVRWQGLAEDQKVWEAVYQLAGRTALAADHDLVNGRHFLQFFSPHGSYLDLVGSRPREFAVLPGTVLESQQGLFRGEQFAPGIRADCRASIVAVSRSVLLSSPVTADIIVCGGDVETYRVIHSIIICDGDFKANNGLCNCVVVARGKVTCKVSISNVFISAHEVELLHGKDACVIHTGQAATPPGLKFFDPAEAGVEVGVDDDGDPKAGTGAAWWLRPSPRTSRSPPPACKAAM